MGLESGVLERPSTARDIDATVHVVPCGNLTVRTCESARRVFHRALERTAAVFRLDLAAVHDCDAAGISLLFCFLKALRGHHGAATVEIVNAPPDVLRQLRGARLDARLNVRIRSAPETPFGVPLPVKETA